MVHDIALEEFLLFSPANYHFTLAPYYSTSTKMCHSPDHAAHYHILGLGASPLTPHLVTDKEMYLNDKRISCSDCVP
jgi:hypothetical protein